MEVVLVRHGSTSWSGRRYCGRSDPPLSRHGRAEAVELAARLAPSLGAGTRLLSSPSRRALATATTIADAMGAPMIVEIDDRWRETDFGLAEGLRFEELEAQLPELAASVVAGSVAIDWPGGETALDLATRVADAWRELIADDRDVVVVSHAGPLLHAVALASGSEADLARIPPPGTALRFDVRAREPIADPC